MCILYSNDDILIQITRWKLLEVTREPKAVDGTSNKGTFEDTVEK